MEITAPPTTGAQRYALAPAAGITTFSRLSQLVGTVAGLPGTAALRQKARAFLAVSLLVQLLTLEGFASEPARANSDSPPQTSVAVNLVIAEPIAPAELQQHFERGRDLYVRNCFVCHQFNGQGIAGVFPPLAKSDSLAGNLERAIKAVVEGISGEIVVNGKKYNGAMPPVALNDADVAGVFTYVLNSWGNAGGGISAAQVQDVRSRTRFRTFEKLQQASTYSPLPEPPPGFNLREVVRLPARGVRLASDGAGRVLYMLTEDGDVFRVETETGQTQQILRPKDYLITRGKDVGGLTFKTVGMAMDEQKRLYIAGNQQDISHPPVQNHVTIYRTTAFANGDPVDPKPWFWTNYPGSPAYIHAAEHIAFGPDGFLYVGNGGRTDAGQTDTDGTWYGGGETPITACIWRIDPRRENPPIDVFARGIRNAYGFCWNEKGEMIATENGPDADPEEELNLIERGKHYGFPYTFADWTKKTYPNTPDAPPGLEFTLPIPNLGPDGGFNGKPLYTFDPHSCPGGIAYLGDDFPEGYRGTYLIARFGNFIRTVKESSGYDIQQAKLRRNATGKYEAEIHTVLAPLGRPIDVHVSGKGKVYILEYSRPTDRKGSYALPGRILELSVKLK
jgi:glucose/arabinose dehydrogenase/mono/diheme cytochrome c family protein